MIATFTATQFGTYQGDLGYFISTCVCDDEQSHHLLFSRSLPVESNEDWGIEIEFGDQANSGCNKIASCVLQRDRLIVKLTDAIGHDHQFEGFDLPLQLPESDWNTFAKDLRTIFSGFEEKLVIGEAEISQVL